MINYEIQIEMIENLVTSIEQSAILERHYLKHDLIEMSDYYKMDKKRAHAKLTAMLKQIIPTINIKDLMKEIRNCRERAEKWRLKYHDTNDKYKAAVFTLNNVLRELKELKGE